MAGLIEQNFGISFALVFATLWLIVTTIVALVSGWFRLMERYPDQSEAPILRLRGQSGGMGPGVRMRGILTLGVCPSGLRVGMMRVFGPFCRDFFVPWENIAIGRKMSLFGRVAKLQFGYPAIGQLTIPAHIADSLARAATSRWPEAGPFPEESRRDVRKRLLREWAILTSIASVLLIVPLAVVPSGFRPLIFVAVFFSTVAIGVRSVVKYLASKG